MNIIIAGDFCPNSRLLKTDILQVNPITDEISNLLSQCDYSIVNLECPVAAKSQKPILKQGPNLCCTPAAISYLKQRGFTAISMANNHIMDYGEMGLLQTIDETKNVGLDYVGSGTAQDPNRQVLFAERDGTTVAIINCCEREFSVTSKTLSGANPLNPIEQYYQILDAKENADYVVVITHGGIEHFPHPTPRMKDTYHFLIDAGADAVVNHHQHCYCGYETYMGKPIFYGLGNFCFDWDGKRNSIWNEGFLVKLSLGNQKVTFELVPYTQCNEAPKVLLMDSVQRMGFDAKIVELNRIMSDEKELERILNEYMNQTESDYLLALEPYSSRVGVGLYKRGLLPSFVTSKRILKLYDYILCESHRDRLFYLLNKEYKKLNNG